MQTWGNSSIVKLRYFPEAMTFNDILSKRSLIETVSFNEHLVNGHLVSPSPLMSLSNL